MTSKEIGELRRRMRPDRTNMTAVRGCYVSDVLSTCGVEEAKLAKFNVEFDQHFGADAALSPANLIDAKKFQLKTPDVTIQVNPERTDLVQTRVIGGVKYLLICADDGVEVNGIQIDLDE